MSKFSDALLSGIATGDPVGAAVNGGLGLMNSLLNRSAIKKQNQLQMDLARENNEFQRKFAIDMFNMENAYNTPVQQMQRLNAAGINGASAFADGASASTGQADGASGISPIQPNTMPVPSVSQGVVDTLGELGQLVKLRSDVDLNDAKSRELLTLLDGKLKSQLLQNEHQELVNDFQRIENDMKNIDLNYYQRKQVASLLKLQRECALLALQGETEKFRKVSAEYQSKMDKLDYEIKDKVQDYLVQIQEKTRDLLEAKVTSERGVPAVQRSEIASNYGSAAASQSVAKLNDVQFSLSKEELDQYIQSRPFMLNMLKSQSGMSDLEFQKFAATLDDQIEILRNHKKITYEQGELIHQNVRKARKEANMYYIQQVGAFVDRALQHAENIAAIASPFVLNAPGFADHPTSPSQWYPGPVAQPQEFNPFNPY